MSQVTVSMQIHIGADDVADWASRRGDAARSRTARMLTCGAEDRAARDEVLIRLSCLRGSIEAIREGSHEPTIATTQTTHAGVAFGSPAGYSGMLFVVRG